MKKLISLIAMMAITMMVYAQTNPIEYELNPYFASATTITTVSGDDDTAYYHGYYTKVEFDSGFIFGEFRIYKVKRNQFNEWDTTNFPVKVNLSKVDWPDRHAYFWNATTKDTLELPFKQKFKEDQLYLGH